MKKRGVARFIAFAVFLACAVYLGIYAYNAKTNSDASGKMAVTASKFSGGSSGGMKAETHIDEETGEEKKLFVLGQYEKLYEQNKNLCGWLKIKGTNIDYPVMKSINGNGQYYLDHNFNGEEDRNGSLFMDDNCDIIKPTENLIIYGHNMKSGQMFGDLDKYKSEAFYKENPIIQFNTIYETAKYQVMMAFQTHVYEENVIAFKYYQFIDPASEKEFESGINDMKEIALYDTGVTAKYGDQLLILSTCDYDEQNGRFVVVCKKLEA